MSNEKGISDKELKKTVVLLEKLGRRWEDKEVKAADMKRASEDFARGEMLPDPLRCRRVLRPH